MAESIGLAVLAFMPHPPLVGLYALAIGGGILLAFDNPLRRSFVTEMVPTEDIPNAVVLYSTIVNVVAHLRAGAGRPAGRDPRVRLVLHDRRRHLSGRPRRASS